MASPSPLSPLPSAALNFSTPSPTHTRRLFEPAATTTTTTTNTSGDHLDSTDNAENADGDSSPFMSHVRDDDFTSPQGTNSPAKARPASRIISGSELSPLKILQTSQNQPPQQQSPMSKQQQQQQQPQQQQPQPQPRTSARTSPSSPPASQTAASTQSVLSPRKSAPIKRFPVKISPPAIAEETTTTTNTRRPSSDRQMSLKDAIRDNEGLKHAIEIFEDEDEVLDGDRDGDADSDDTLLMSCGSADQYQELGSGDNDDPAGMDDTMASTFSTFSAVPNMTMFANLRSNSPPKHGAPTPRGARAEPEQKRTPRAPATSSDRMAAQQQQQHESGNTMNLMDFTEQLRYSGYERHQPSSPLLYRRPVSPARNGSATSAAGNGAVAATPQRHSAHLVNLLDFDIPPMPTPRSVPTITPRELESLKSGFLSEISSLKASLSGKEAEVLSLKSAVGDAEGRVGECLEQLRDLRGMQDTLASEKDSWEKRGREMETVLRKVKEEIVLGQREREELEFKLDEAEKRREAAEMMAQEAESKMAGMRAGKASAEAASADSSLDSNNRIRSPATASGSNKEVEIAVERVARELHALYKGKHEVKVAALKKSYENRWEKRVRELENRIEELTRENDEIRSGRDATITRVDLARLSELEQERKAEKARDAVHIKGLEAEVDKLEAVLRTVQDDNAELRVLLERERVEKGELVQLAEEMMNMQSFVQQQQQQQQQQQEQLQQQQQQQQQQAASVPAPAPAPASYGSRSNSRGSNNGSATAPTPIPDVNRTPARRSVVAPRSTPVTGRAQQHQQQQPSENMRGSVSGRPSSLRAPMGLGLKSATAESRIGRFSTHERTKSAAVSGMPRPGSGLGTRGTGHGLMSSIEKMGSYRGTGRD
ncbi:hypothetical protein B0T19DRAFT_460450 [Cercophora scortea]|uniref:Uncharacterized protein n=1 Tax=Cercophora scortea TaxID=314031 RepID=A0AAE0ILG4_9PEZI|nr:hypothetical protein B0T19DRAFT_460450 [Cercophora scortea]